MAVRSMTGYASSDGIACNVAWMWELRAVNGKGLDIRMRIPSGFEGLEQKLRGKCADVLTRGNLQISLTAKEQGAATELVVNQSALNSIIKIAKDLEDHGFDKSSTDGLLSIRGVLEERHIERSDEEQSQLLKSIEDGFYKALGELVKARETEGNALADVLRGQISQIEEGVEKVIADPSRSQKAIKERLQHQVQNLIDSNSNFDEERLYVEAAILATKADLQEEIDRLLAHIDSANALLDEGGAIGRRLDFLAQEFNRECNTICSKSNAAAVTAVGLELKVLVDQFREQIQNVE
ncbi:MAG: YicC family protein [Rhizobiaceae bacterium]|nr:YicC family protein [Rhizobiaceae bacterium]